MQRCRSCGFCLSCGEVDNGVSCPACGNVVPQRSPFRITPEA